MMVHIILSTEGRLAHQTRYFAMFWSILAASFIRKTFSSHSFTPELLRNEGTEMGQSSRFSDRVVHTDELTELAKEGSFDTKEKIMLQSNHDAFDGSPDEKKETSHRWQQNLFKYDLHSSGKDFDPWGQKVSHFEPEETVKAAREDLKRLKRGLETNQYRLKYIGTETQTAHDLFEDIVERATSLLEVLIGEKLDARIVSSSGGNLPFDIRWNVMAAHFKTQFKEVLDLLLKSKVRGYGVISDETLSDQKDLLKRLLRSQTFIMINTFLKYTLLEEHWIKIWLNDNSDLLYALSRHIFERCSPPTFLRPDLQEILSNSSTAVHLGFVLNLLDARSWTYIEGQYLNIRHGYIVGHFQIENGGRFSVLTQTFGKVFSVYKMALQQAHLYATDSNLNAERGELIRSIISYITYPQRVPASEYNLMEYGYLYELLRFIMRYHTDLVEKALCEDYSPSRFSKDIKVMEAAISWLKSAREISFVAKSLWTTDVDAKQSKNLIKLEEVHDHSFESGVELSYFQQNFQIYTTKDETRWQGLFNSLANAKVREIGKPAINVNSKYGWINLPTHFGTNFCLENKGKGVLSEGEELENLEKQVSGVFLSDIHDWLARLKFLHQNFREKRSLFLKLTNTESTKSELAMINQAKDEIQKSSILQVIFHEISKNSSEAQYFWNRVRTRLQQLNWEIFTLDISSKQKEGMKMETKAADDSTEMEDMVGLPLLKNDYKPGVDRELAHPKSSQKSFRNELKAGVSIPFFDFVQDSKLLD